MPISVEENRLLTEVENDAPMGRLMRENYWFPFMRAAALKPGAQPRRVTLLGQDYVVFRAEDGRIGFFDEGCPHRCASLVLARVEGCALRCIFHGWKFDVSGEVLETPTEPTNAEDFARTVKMNRYPVKEAGQLLWVWLGENEAPALPKLPFFDLKDENVWVTLSYSDCNWLQGVEGTLDSAHIGHLHRSWMEQRSQVVGGTSSLRTSKEVSTPRYEVQLSEYGLRAAALRKTPDGLDYLRVSEYFMPFVSMVPSSGNDEGVIFIAVPVDNHRHLLFYGEWAKHRKVEPEYGGMFGTGNYDPDNYAQLTSGRDNNWSQDRSAMDKGHFSGFVRNLVEEDIVVQLSMGKIVDRSKEHLSSSDVAIVHARRMLLQAVKEVVEEGRLPRGSALAGDVTVRHPLDTLLPVGQGWKEAVQATIAAE